MYSLSFLVGFPNIGARRLTIAAVACAVFSLVFGAHFPVFADDEKCNILRNARVSLKEAIENVLTKYEGFPIKAELEEKDGMYYYEIDLVSEGGRSKIFVNPANGLEIGLQQKTGVAIRFQRIWESKLAAVLETNISLLEAIETAQATSQGFIAQAELKSRHKPHVFEITVLDGEIERELLIDVSQGEIIDIYD